jgi:hypothetical protein
MSFCFQVKPADHKLVLQVFDENRLTRDDFLGMVELTLINLPKEAEGRTIQTKQYILRPRRSVLLALHFYCHCILLYSNFTTNHYLIHYFKD